MTPTIASAIMGFILAVLSIGGIFLNVLVIIAIIHSKMMKLHSPVYIFAFATIINDMLMIFLHLFYFAPSCFFQDFLFPDIFVEEGRKVLDLILMICWYHGTLSHIVIAINRFVTVIFYQYPIFTRNRVVIIASIQIIGSVGLAVMTQFIFPCCRLSLTYTVYTYTYLEIPGVPNYTNMFDLPLNSVASITPLFAYSGIALVLYRSNEKIGTARIREYIFAIQFAIMALIYTLVWMSVRVLPMVLTGTDKLYLYGITTCLTLCNTSTNAVVYLTNNREIKKSLRSFNNAIQTSSTVVPSSKRIICDFIQSLISGTFEVPANVEMAILLIISLVLTPASSLSNFPIVQTSYGSVRGYEYQANNGFVAEIFKKIPYASPPIGSRRWKKPVPPEEWNYTIDGTFFGPGCAQYPPRFATGHSEDCLTLNIYTSRACRESNSSCPVAFFIHGGNAVTGGTMGYPDEALVTNFASKGIVLVTMDYRLGIFGVLALGDENVVPANIAIHDVMESLRFTRKEIYNFGGDKEQLTVMGHSTGATMVLIIAFSPGINKLEESSLFSRAIAMSPSAVFNEEEAQVAMSHFAANALGCYGSAQEIIDCLMLMSTEEIMDGMTEKVESKAEVRDIALAGELLPFRNVKELHENQKPIKLLIGSTLDELGYEPSKKKDHTCIMIGARNIEECVAKYERDTASGEFEPVYNVVSQAYFMLNWQLTNAQARAGGEVYLYQYDYPLNAIHAQDLFYVLGSRPRELDSNEEWLSHVYPLYFTNFIKGLPLAPDWKSLDSDLMNYYSINKSFTDGVMPQMKIGYHQTLADYYNNMVELDENLTKMKEMQSNAPIQYKELILQLTDTFSIRDIIFYSTLLGFIFFVVFQLNRFCLNKNRAEKTPLILAHGR